MSIKTHVSIYIYIYNICICFEVLGHILCWYHLISLADTPPSLFLKFHMHSHAVNACRSQHCQQKSTFSRKTMVTSLKFNGWFTWKWPPGILVRSLLDTIIFRWSILNFFRFMSYEHHLNSFRGNFWKQHKQNKQHEWNHESFKHVITTYRRIEMNPTNEMILQVHEDSLNRPPPSGSLHRSYAAQRSP